LNWPDGFHWTGTFGKLRTEFNIMKTEIPEALKTDVPQTKWGKLLLATPVVMTVIATLLAGLASSEMTRAQYDRAFAAQLQSKAGDQWSYFQAKRLRGVMQRNTLDLLRSTTTVRPLDEAALKPFGALSAQTVAALQTGQLPPQPPATLDPKVRAALAAVEQSRPEKEIAPLIQALQATDLDAALKDARAQAQAFDLALQSVNEALDRIDRSLAASPSSDATRDFTAARLRCTASRYDAEARLNQAVANVLELQVRLNNLAAERHHRRSGWFFFGMLAAQAAVIIATFAIAAQKRNLLWSLAAVAGLGAITFAIYVYLRM
jgi:hypothetical protein